MTYVVIRYNFEVIDSKRLHDKARIIDPELYEELEDIGDATAFSVLIDRLPLNRISPEAHGVQITSVETRDQGG